MLTEDMIKKLVDAGVVVLGTNFYDGPIPANVTLPAGGILESPGTAPQETLNDGITFERCAFQIMVRGEPTEVGHKDARKFIGDIWKVLAGTGGSMGIANEVINGVMYQNVSARQSPFFLGTDDNNKRLYVANFDVEKEVS